MQIEFTNPFKNLIPKARGKDATLNAIMHLPGNRKMTASFHSKKWDGDLDELTQRAKKETVCKAVRRVVFNNIQI